MRLIFIRHPQTQANVARVIYGRTESDYSEEGARSIPGIVAELRDIPVDRIYASPLKRTAFLAGKIAEAYRPEEEIRFDDRLMEMNFGVFENLSTEEAKALPGGHYDRLMADYSNYVIPEGESFQQVKERVREFLEELKAEEIREQKENGRKAEGACGENGEGESEPFEEIAAQYAQRKTYVIVAHSMVIRGALSHLLDISLDAVWHLRIEPGSRVDVLYDYDYAMLQGLTLPEGGTGEILL